jgi:hypothetical protein
VDPRTPQKLNLAMASLIYLNRLTLVHTAISRNQIQSENYANIQVLPWPAVIVAVTGRTVNQFARRGVKLPISRPTVCA